MEKSKIPDSVIHSFDYLLARFGGDVSFVGDCEAGEVYSYDAPADLDLGFPEICLWDGASAVRIGGFSALDILSSMSENP